MSLVARHLEAHGIPTVVLGSARDIVEQCGVPRFVFTDFPLGNPCGKPGDKDMQRAIVGMALDLLETALSAYDAANAFRWDETGEWRETYMELPREHSGGVGAQYKSLNAMGPWLLMRPEAHFFHSKSDGCGIRIT